MWDACGMARNGAGLEHAMDEIATLHERFRAGVRVLGDDETLNQSLEKAGRVDDFFELAQLMCRDALHREESCGGHFREEHQTPDGEALRDDENFSYVAAWEYPRRAAQGAAARSSTCARPSGATHEADAADLAPGRARTLRARSRPTRSTSSARRCRSSSCSTC